MKKHIFYYLIFFLISHFSHSQNNSFSEFVKTKLNTYKNKDYAEKVYLHTDKSNYAIDENIWFSAYLVNATNHLTSKKSKIVHVELINENDSIVSFRRLYMKDISTAGHFFINKDYKQGKYYLRAYTNYMRNSKKVNFYKKKITIWAKDQTLKEAQKKNTLPHNIEPNLNFYPESGYLVNGIENNVAIKIKNDFYEDISLSISILDNNNELITTFKSTKFGLGMFKISPEQNKSYKAVVEFNENSYVYPLPKALLSGEVINVIKGKKHLLVSLKSNRKKGLLGSNLVIHQRGNFIYNSTHNTITKRKLLKIPIDSLKNGVLHLTLFNNENKPVCERLLFVDNNLNTARVNIDTSKEYFGNRRKVSLDIDVTDLNMQALKGHLSLSVFDTNTFGHNKNDENIKTWLLLNSDLRGKVKNPHYFFTEGERSKKNYLLDLVMMTNGWRRFTWQSVLNNNSTKKEFPIEKGLFINGKTFSMKSPYGLISADTRLTFMGDIIEQEPIKKSDKNGKFSYGPFIFFDTIPILLEARKTNFKSVKNRDRKVLIVQDKDIKRPSIDKSLKNKNTINDALLTYKKYQKFLKEIDSAFKDQKYVLDEVVVSSKRKTKEDIRREEMNKRTSYGTSFRRFDMQEDGATSNTAYELFYGVPGVNIINDSIYLRSAPNRLPLILYDETPIEVLDLQSINADQVSFIDLLVGPDAAVFASGGGGVISIYSKLGNGSGLKNTKKRKPGIIDFKAIGLHTAKEFYAPDHINGIEEQTKQDTRTTLHWNPKIITTKEGKTKIEFFTSDYDSTYLIQIEGITEDGIPVYGTSSIIVD